VQLKCKRVYLQILRGCMHRSDYFHYFRTLVSENFLIGLYIHWFFLVLAYYLQYSQRTTQTTIIHATNQVIGGGKNIYSYQELYPYFLKDVTDLKSPFQFVSYIVETELSQETYVCKMPLAELCPKLLIAQLRIVAVSHGIFVHSKKQAHEILDLLSDHECTDCKSFVAVFEPVPSKPSQRDRNLIAVKKYQKHNLNKYRKDNLRLVKRHQENDKIAFRTNNLAAVRKYQLKKKTDFPPPPLTDALEHLIISEACNDMRTNKLNEKGCAVCGALTPV